MKKLMSPEIWEDSIIALEHGSVYSSKLAGLHSQNTYDKPGVL